MVSSHSVIRFLSQLPPKTGKHVCVDTSLKKYLQWNLSYPDSLGPRGVQNSEMSVTEKHTSQS